MEFLSRVLGIGPANITPQVVANRTLFIYLYNARAKKEKPVIPKKIKSDSVSSLVSGKSMGSVNIRWSNLPLNVHSSQNEPRAWLNEYNPLISCSWLIEKPGNYLIGPDRCWDSGLILLIAICSNWHSSFLLLLLESVTRMLDKMLSLGDCLHSFPSDHLVE